MRSQVKFILFSWFVVLSFYVSAAEDKASQYYGYIPSDEEVDTFWFSINSDSEKHIFYYYPKGNIKRKYRMGGVCGVQIGTEYYYTEIGVVQKSIQHLNYGATCSEAWSVKKVTKYNDQGRPISIYSYKIGSESTEACKCEQWITFDSKGRKQLNKKTYPRCSIANSKNSQCYEIE